MKNINVKGGGFFCSLSTQIYNITLSVGLHAYISIWFVACILYSNYWVLWVWIWSWLHDFLWRAVSYISYLHDERIADKTQLRVDLDLDLVLGA